MARIGITILGATGSIGKSTLDVLDRHPDTFKVFALTANRNVGRMAELCNHHHPEYAVMADSEAAKQLEEKLGDHPTEVLSGNDALEEVASHNDVSYVMAAIVGAAGLLPSLAAARSGKRVLLANKEALVISGALFMQAIKENGATLLPIDSEHNAIFQCLPPNFSDGLERAGVERILLTASGGPFRTLPLESFSGITPEQAVAHPNWEMGKKISVDSATMMNKGLEVIEAHWLFGASAEQIQVVLHPQSIIHSMVSYSDGSVLAQLGNPDMRTPIAHALAWPNRMQSGVNPLDIFDVAQLNFEQADHERFPCLALAYQALRAGGTAPAILNAANEVAVAAFLQRQISFTSIPSLIGHVMDAADIVDSESLETILHHDSMARLAANQFIEELAA